MRLDYCLLLFVLYISKAQSQILQSVSDDELLQFIKEEEKLIVLFCKLCLTAKMYYTYM